MNRIDEIIEMVNRSPDHPPIPADGEVRDLLCEIDRLCTINFTDRLPVDVTDTYELTVAGLRCAIGDINTEQKYVSDTKVFLVISEQEIGLAMEVWV